MTASNENLSALYCLRTADLNWIEKTVLTDPQRQFSELSNREVEWFYKVLDFLREFTNRAAWHEGSTDYASVRDEVIADYIERIARAAARSRLERRLIRVIWRMHSPRSWLVHRIKARMSSGGVRPGIPRCAIAAAPGQPSLRSRSFCLLTCDLQFLTQGLELSLMEVAYVLEMAKSSAAQLVSQCQSATKPTVAKRLPVIAGGYTPQQACAIWDMLRGETVRSAGVIRFSWREELLACWKWIWWRWR